MTIVSSAVLVLMSVPLRLSLKAIPSMLSTPISVLTAVLALTLVPLRLSSPHK